NNDGANRGRLTGELSNRGFSHEHVLRRANDNLESNVAGCLSRNILTGIDRRSLRGHAERAGGVSPRCSALLSRDQAGLEQHGVPLLPPGEPREAQQGLPRRTCQTGSVIGRRASQWLLALPS